MKADIECAYKICGQHPEYVQGKMTKKTICRVPVDLVLHIVEKNLRVYKKFLITVSNQLCLTVQTQIENEGLTMLGMALQGQLALLQS
jgi:hypothetical protein